MPHGGQYIGPWVGHRRNPKTNVIETLKAGVDVSAAKEADWSAASGSVTSRLEAAHHDTFNPIGTLLRQPRLLRQTRLLLLQLPG